MKYRRVFRRRRRKLSPAEKRQQTLLDRLLTRASVKRTGIAATLIYSGSDLETLLVLGEELAELQTLTREIEALQEQIWNRPNKPSSKKKERRVPVKVQAKGLR